MNNTPDAEHQDAISPEDSPNNGAYRSPMEYAPSRKKGERKYGTVEERGSDIHVCSPVENVGELSNRAHLTAQFHEKNRPHWEENSPLSNNGGRLYDSAILDLFEETLKCEGIDPSDPSINIPLSRMKVLFLRRAREQSGTESYEYLTEEKTDRRAILNKLGYMLPCKLPSYQTFQRTYNTLHGEDTDTIDGEAFETAVTRAVYAVYRAGIVPPDAVRQKYDFDVLEPPLDERRLPRNIKKAELCDIVRDLFDVTIEPLTFGRNVEQNKYDMKAFIGALAVSASKDTEVANAKNVCDWNYPRDRIPGGSWMDNYVSELPLDAQEEPNLSSEEDSDEPILSIDEQFNAVHRLTLQYAKDRGFWPEEDSSMLGIDMFRVDWSGESLDATIGRPPKADNDAVTEEWTFLIAGGAEPDNRFILGGRWLNKLSDYPTAVREIVSNAVPPASIDTILIDSEIAGGELIDTLWDLVGEDWIISAPDAAVAKALKRLTPANHMAYAPNINWNTDSETNLVTYPTDGNDPDPVLVDYSELAIQAIQQEGEGDKIPIPLKHRLGNNPTQPTSLEPDPDVPHLTEAIDDLETAAGIGSEDGLAAYLTGRSLQNRSDRGRPRLPGRTDAAESHVTLVRARGRVSTMQVRRLL